MIITVNMKNKVHSEQTVIGRESLFKIEFM